MVEAKLGKSRLNEEKENRSWTMRDNDPFRFAILAQQVKDPLRVRRFLSASMVVYLRFNSRFWVQLTIQDSVLARPGQWIRQAAPPKAESHLLAPAP